MKDDKLTECPECGKWTQEGEGCRCLDCQEKAANKLACFNNTPSLFRSARISYLSRGIFLVVAEGHVVAGTDGVVARFESDEAAVRALTEAGYKREEGIQNLVFKP